MGISAPFATGVGGGGPYAFFTGLSASAAQIGARWHVALAGHPYMIDLSGYRRETLDVIRQQADTSTQPGEQSFAPFSLWRRTLESWHHGAGQTNFDLAGVSNPNRYHTSKGIDPWTPGQLGLLNDTTEVLSSSENNLKLCIAGTRIYVLDGQSVKFTTSLSGTPSWTTVSGTPSETPQSLTTDGTNIWIAYPSGPYVTTTSTSTASAFGTEDVDLMVHCQGRLVCAHDNDLFELDGSGSVVGTGIYSHGFSGFKWDVIAPAPNGIYVAGHQGIRGEVYRIDINEATTALDNLYFCAALPDGEYITSMLHYVGVMVLGTNKGVRLASIDGSGNLNYGVLIPTGAAVNCLEGDDRFVWFGWTNYDSTSTGLGRLDLSVFTDTLRPAYASDLMVADQGTIVDCATFDGRRVFTLAGEGVYTESSDKVPSGTITSGWMRWGTTERKFVHTIDLRTGPLPAGAEVGVAVAYGDGTSEAVSVLSTTNATGPTRPFSTRNRGTEQAEVTLTVNQANNAAADVTVQRVTIRALVAPPRTEQIILPIILKDTVDVGRSGGQPQKQNPVAEYQFLRRLCREGRPVIYQEFDFPELVVVEKVGFRPETLSGVERPNRWMQGTAEVVLRTLEN